MNRKSPHAAHDRSTDARSEPCSPVEIVSTTAIEGVVIAQSRCLTDRRGAFARLFDADLLAPVHAARPIVQVNQSLTLAVGAIRGMHYQRAPAAEAKWVRCLQGRALDVAVDLRRGSPTFLRYVACELSPEGANALFIPEGCAHGFQVLASDTMLLYLHSAAYAPEHEGAVRWDDPRIAIDWPLPPTEISDRDRGHPLLADDFEGLM